MTPQQTVAQEPVERGAAGLRLILSDGVIKAHHGEDNCLLFTGVAKKGAWDRIIKSIVRNCTEASGPMSDACGKV